jgi:hypothetical protein
MPAVTAIAAISQATRLTSSCNGLGPESIPEDKAATRPSWVCIPVANTAACASPLLHVAPLHTRSSASSGAVESATSVGVRDTGTDSPVSAERSIATRPDRTRASALMRSPSRTTIKSPGTRSRASISVSRASRMTVACVGRYALSASTARTACCSWANARPALRTITATIAHPRTMIPPANAKIAAAMSSSASGCVNWAARSLGQVRRVRLSSSFGPTTRSRRAASREDSPPAPL